MFLRVSCFLLFMAAMVSCTPRCPIPTCYTRMVHTHEGTKYRGQPLLMKQNPRIGEKVKDPIREGVKRPRSERKNRR